MEIIIHIGLHKTGSTLIQKSFLKNYDEGVKNGVLFPKTGFVNLEERHGAPGTSAGHDLYVKAALTSDQKFRARIMAALSEEIAKTKPQKVFISAENFSHHLLGDISKNTRGLFGDMGNARILVTLRNPYEWMESYYRDRVTSGWEFETLSLSRFIRKHSTALNFQGIIRRWESAFGADSIDIFVHGPEIKRIGLTNACRRYLGFPSELKADDCEFVNSGAANDFVAAVLAYNRKVLPIPIARKIVTEFKKNENSDGFKKTLLQYEDVKFIEKTFQSYSKDLYKYNFVYGNAHELERKPEILNSSNIIINKSEKMLLQYRLIKLSNIDKIYGMSKYMLSKMPIKFQVLMRRCWMRFSPNKYNLL